METGQHIGRYQLREKIGKGGMAEIFKAEESLEGGGTRTVAIKRLFPKLSADREFVGMFVNEALIAASMDHPNIIRTYDLINYGSYYYIVMEYLEGLDLEELVMLKAPGDLVLSQEEVAYAVHETAMGLAYAHASRRDEKSGPIVHRDISPGNILVGCDGQVKITDFGIARATQYASFTRPGVLKGKYEYMAPEYVKGYEFDGRADLFSLGVVLYELLTGENPFMGVGPQDIWDKIVNFDPAPPSSMVPSIPRTMDKVVERALCKDPDDRYADGESFAAVLVPFFVEQGKRRTAAALGGRARQNLYERKHPATTPGDFNEFLPPEEGGDDSTREFYLDELLDLVEPVDVPNPVKPPVNSEMVTAPKLAAVKRLTGNGKRKKGHRGLLLVVVAVLLCGGGLAVLFWPGPKGFLSVDSDLRAEIYVDGKRMGLAPLKEMPIDIGRHVIEARRPGRNQSKSYHRQISEGQKIDLHVKWANSRRRKRRTIQRRRRKTHTKKYKRSAAKAKGKKNVKSKKSGRRTRKSGKHKSRKDSKRPKHKRSGNARHKK